MIHSNGLKGGVNHTYGGEIDVMPTLMDLLGGLKNTDTIQLGNDLLSENRNQTVAFRNGGDFVSPTYSKIGSKVYDSNGQVASNLTTEQKKSVDGMQARTNKVLSLSDKIVTGDLLRFYTPSGFKKVDKRQYSYKYSDGIKLLKKQQQTSKSSLIQQKGGHSTTDLFTTDAPELK